MIKQFHDHLGQTLSIYTGNRSIILEIEAIQGREQRIFCLDPNDFGDVAAALWECSPTKQPITITGTQTEGDTARRADEAGHKSQDSSSTREEAQAKDVDLAKASDAGTGSGQATNSRVESGS